jgi:hypothetical protein
MKNMHHDHFLLTINLELSNLKNIKEKLTYLTINLL